MTNLSWFQKASLAKAKASWKQADSVHLNAVLREQLSSGVTAETHRCVEAPGRGGEGGYTLFLQRGVQKSWGWGGKGSGDPLASQLSQQDLQRVKHLGRQMFAWTCFSPQPVRVFIVLGHGKACWLLEAVQAPGAVCCCL